MQVYIEMKLIGFDLIPINNAIEIYKNNIVKAKFNPNIEILQQKSLLDGNKNTSFEAIVEGYPIQIELVEIDPISERDPNLILRSLLPHKLKQDIFGQEGLDLGFYANIVSHVTAEYAIEFMSVSIK